MGKLAERLSVEQWVARHVVPHSTVALGGCHFHGTPMAAVREIVRQGIPIKTLIPPVDGSFNADMLIGAGLVEEVYCPYVGLEIFGMAGRFRAAAESGRLRIRESEEAGFVMGLRAGAAGMPFVALPEGFFPMNTDLPTVPTANPDDYREVTNPFTGRKLHVVRAIQPDVAIIHCQYVDQRGNGGFLGSPFHDLESAKAAARCLVLAEEEVDELPGNCTAFLPGFIVDAICVRKGGAHPGSSAGMYDYDGRHLAEYAAASRTETGFAAYRRDVIGPSEDHYKEVVSKGWPTGQAAS